MAQWASRLIGSPHDQDGVTCHMTPDQAVVLQQLINGLSLGMMYALLALGFTMVYGIIELINFAHFNVFMAGTFFGLWFLALLGYGRNAAPLSGHHPGAGVRRRIRRSRW